VSSKQQNAPPSNCSMGDALKNPLRGVPGGRSFIWLIEALICPRGASAQASLAHGEAEA